MIEPTRTVTPSPRLQRAARRATARRAERSGAVTLAVLGALMAYVWALFHSTLHLVVTWRWPPTRPYTFEEVAELGVVLSVANALWALLLVGTLVRAVSGPRHVRRSRVVPLLLAIVVVGMMQRVAFLVLEAAEW